VIRKLTKDKEEKKGEGNERTDRDEKKGEGKI
jgi:hypothetical protein